MHLWMQLLQNANILMNPADGEGGDLGGGAGDQAPNTEGAEQPAQTPAEGEQPAQAPSKDKPLTDTEAALLKDVMKHKEAAKKARDAEQQLRESIGDLDLAEVRQILAEKKAAETKALEERGEYERVKQSMAEQHKLEVAQLQAKIEELKGSKSADEKRINDLTVGTQFTQSSFILEELVLPPTKARALYGEHFEVEDGKIVGYDKPRGAPDRTTLVDAYGQALSFEDAMRKIIEADPEKDHLIKSKAKPGAGSSSVTKTPGINVPAKQLTGQEKIQAGLASLLKNPAK